MERRRCPFGIFILNLDKLRMFFTAKIGFHAYTETDLKLFSEGIRRNRLIEKIKCRTISETGEYEILSGHNRARPAVCLLEWETTPSPSEARTQFSGCLQKHCSYD